jgi:hypothetical protein
MDPALINKLLMVALPSLAAGVVVFAPLWWRLNQRGAALDPIRSITPDSTAGEPLWATPLVLGLLTAVMTQVIRERVSLVPHAGADWLLWVAVATGVLGGAAKLVRVGAGPRWLVRVALMLAVGWVVLRQPILNRFTTGQSALWLGGFVVWTGVALWALERVAHRARGPAGPAVMAIFAGAASQLLVLGYASLSLGQVPSVLAAALVGIAAVAVWRPRLSLAFGGAEVPVVVCAASLLLGLFAASIDTGATKPFLWAGLLLLCPLAALLADVPPLARWTGPAWGWKRLVLRVALAATPAGAAVGGAASTYQFPDASDDPYALVQPVAPAAATAAAANSPAAPAPATDAARACML